MFRTSLIFPVLKEKESRFYIIERTINGKMSKIPHPYPCTYSGFGIFSSGKEWGKRYFPEEGGGNLFGISCPD
jgi:hypothetical protein